MHASRGPVYIAKIFSFDSNAWEQELSFKYSLAEEEKLDS